MKAPSFFSASLIVFGLCLFDAQYVAAADWNFRSEEFANDLGVGYAVRLADINEDGHLDILVVDKRRLVWYEAPTWKVHEMLGPATKPDNVCMALHDIDGDNRFDVALGADWTLNTAAGGTIQWLRRARYPLEGWDLLDIGEEPTVHRMHWADIDADGQDELLVCPLLGRGTTRPDYQENGVRLLAYEIPDDPVAGPWRPTVITDELHVTHNFLPVDVDADGQLEILIVSFEGVSLLKRVNEGSWQRTLIGAGNQETSPNKGASEVKWGRLADGSPYIATIEPWHGHQVVLYTPPTDVSDRFQQLWTRHVIDEELQWGHAVWCANLDGDADEELVVGVRDDKDERHRRGLRIYDPRGGSPRDWVAERIEPGAVAIEDLAVADMDQDGDQDIVVVGRQTNNAKIYWNDTAR
jgi:hypothetical protein